jgi:hypothetical protein
MVRGEGVPIQIGFPYKPDQDGHIHSLRYTKSCAGCSQSSEALYFTHRKESLGIYNFLEDNTAQPRVIRGPSGCGKSTAAWRYTVEQARKGKSICWVNLKEWKATYFKDYHLHPPLRFAPVVTVVEGLLTAGLQILVLDGLRDNTMQALITLIEAAVEREVDLIIVSAQQLPLKGACGGMAVYSAKAWTMEEYFEACSHDLFFSQVLINLLPSGAVPQTTYGTAERRELLERKWFFAGHSARWMFDRRDAEIVAEIRESLERVVDFGLLFDVDPETCGRAYREAQYTVMLTDPAEYQLRGESKMTFTSQLVGRMLSRRVGHAAIKKLHEFVSAHGNPSMERQALQIDFINSLYNQTLAGRVYYVNETGLGGPTARALEPEPTLTHPHISNQIIEFSQDALPEESAYTDVGTWFVPKVWYECDFEAAQIREVAPGTLSLCVVKIAATEQLDLGIHGAVDFLQSLNALRARGGASSAQHTACGSSGDAAPRAGQRDVRAGPVGHYSLVGRTLHTIRRGAAHPYNCEVRGRLQAGCLGYDYCARVAQRASSAIAVQSYP